MASVDMGTPSRGWVLQTRVRPRDVQLCLTHLPTHPGRRSWVRTALHGVRRAGGGRRGSVTTTDAVVIGSGPNGLVAANLLVDAGWSVVVLEEQDRPGGAVASDDAVAPGHVHDTFSSFYPLAAASPTIRGLSLEEHGLEWSHAPSVLGHSFGGGQAWLALCETWDRVGDDVLRGLLSPFPPVRGGAGLARQVLRPGGLELLREMTMPARSLTERLFRGEAARMLVAGNAGHADIGLESPGSAAMGLLLALLGQSVGFPVPRGGA